MKNLKLVLLLVGVLMMTAGLNAQEKKKKNETVKYWVSMSCENCKAKVEKNIAYEKGVKDMVVDLDTKTVTVKYQTKKTNPEKIEQALKDLGYKTERIVEKKETEETKKG